jgi:tripartite ATP-independent transporter DctM subunit
MAPRAINTLDQWFGRVPGRLSLLTVVAATLFSTVSGSHSATTAMLGKTLVPEMRKRGYSKVMSIGPVVGTGGLAMLIPPSTLAVFWAVIAEVSIGKVLMACAIPGLVIAFLCLLYVISRCYFQPSIAPAYDVSHVPLVQKLNSTTKYVIPLLFLVFMVTGLIFLGVAIPSEAAAMGVLGSIILAAAYKDLNWRMIKASFGSTVMISGMLILMVCAAMAFGQILAYQGGLAQMVSSVMTLALSPIQTIIMMMIILLFLGMFLSEPVLIVIGVPIFMPIIYTLGYDPVWFGALYLIIVEMGTFTPPYGTLLFVMKGVSPPDVTMVDIIKAGIPFLICDAVALSLLLVFPILALWLPQHMFR